MPKSSKGIKKAPRHSPLGNDIEADMNSATQLKPIKSRNAGSSTKKAIDEDMEFMSASMSRKVLKESRAQQKQLENEERDENDRLRRKEDKMLSVNLHDGDDDGFDSDTNIGTPSGLTNDGEYVDCGEEENLTDADRRILESFMSAEAAPRRTLADIIMEKIQEKEERQRMANMGMTEGPAIPHINPKVEQVYRKVGHLLKTYKSGKLPKAFKIIPSLNNWEEVLLLTNPDDWSAQAMWHATRIFASNFNQRMYVCNFKI